MKRVQMDKLFLYLSIFGFLMAASSCAFAAFVENEIILRTMFWFGLALGIALQVVLGQRRRNFLKKNGINGKNIRKSRIGLLNFAANSWALAADLGFFASLIATVVAMVATRGYGIVCYYLIGSSILFFCLHCIFNGKIYFYIKNQKKIQRFFKKRRSKTFRKGEGEQ